MYRVHFTAALANDPEELAVTDEFTWQVESEMAMAAPTAANTFGGRFPGGQTILFQGAPTDPVTGLAYHRARWYDPRNAAFLSEDPLEDVDSTNIYGFVAWSPAMQTDPLGLRARTSREGWLLLRSALIKMGRLDLALTIARDEDTGDLSIVPGKDELWDDASSTLPSVGRIRSVVRDENLDIKWELVSSSEMPEELPGAYGQPSVNGFREIFGLGTIWEQDIKIDVDTIKQLRYLSEDGEWITVDGEPRSRA